MFKQITHIVLMGIVIFSLMAPSVIPLFECENDAIVLIDLTEEENKKENKKELDEKDVYFQDLLNSRSIAYQLSGDSRFFYESMSSDFHQQIILPPPESRS